jgi:hypothetical protein
MLGSKNSQEIKIKSQQTKATEQEKSSTNSKIKAKYELLVQANQSSIWNQYSHLRELHGPHQYEMLELKLYEEGTNERKTFYGEDSDQRCYYAQWISAEDMFLYNPKAMNQWCEQQQIDKWRYEYLSGYKVTKLREKQLKWIKKAKKK